MWNVLVIIFLVAGGPRWSSAAPPHDFHVSLCELRWNESSSAFEVSIKIFIDDLELALEREDASGLFIGTPKEASTADAFIATYLEKRFKIDIDGTLLDLVFIGKEVSDDFQAVWCYVEFSGLISSARKCTISNAILLEIYDDQRNIMDIQMNKNHKAYTIFQPGRSTWSYTF